MSNLIRIVVMATLMVSISGCSSLLPDSKQSTQSPWKNFTEAKQAFDKIIPDQTTETDLRELGFDPYLTPNVILITYLDILQKFIPNQSIRMEDLPTGVADCIKLQSLCNGYLVEPQARDSKRYGNAFLDVFNFNRKTVTTGWKFTALIVINDDKVVYKLWGGEPHILVREEKQNPLGPLQNIGEIINF